MVPKNLSVRVHRCDCGLVLDRDVNAARKSLTVQADALKRLVRIRTLPGFMGPQ